MAERCLLVDLGGTNTRVGVSETGVLLQPSVRTYSNRAFTGLAQLLARYMQDMSMGTINAICAGVAGPVRDNSAQLTNLEWFIDGTALCEATGADSVWLINDLQAQGFALNDLSENALTPLFSGPTEPKGTRLVLGLGTGCNIAVVHQINGRLFVPPSESGHTTLPWCDSASGELMAHLRSIHPHLPIESALSGPGLQNIYNWISGKHASAEQILSTPMDEDERQSISIFCRILGHVAGDFALSHLPKGGVFLIGGLARAIAPHLHGSSFYNSFCAKGPYEQIVREIPITLIDDDYAALRGCARYFKQVTG